MPYRRRLRLHQCVLPPRSRDPGSRVKTKEKCMHSRAATTGMLAPKHRAPAVPAPACGLAVRRECFPPETDACRPYGFELIQLPRRFFCGRRPQISQTRRLRPYVAQARARTMHRSQLRQRLRDAVLTASGIPFRSSMQAIWISWTPRLHLWAEQCCRQCGIFQRGGDPGHSVVRLSAVP